MIFVIVNYGVDRNQEGRSWITKGVTFAVASVVAGAATGGVLGAVGAVLPVAARHTVALVIAAGALAIGAARMIGADVRVPQRQCETGQLWMHSGAITGAVLNGAALGAGFVTRVGYWLWYAVPLAAFLSGHGATGALIYGSYALVRGLAPLAAVTRMRLAKSCAERDITRMQQWMIERAPLARKLGDAQLVVTACALLAIWGA